MEYRLRPLGFMEFLQSNNHQTVKKMKLNCLMIVVLQKPPRNPGVAVYIP